MARYLVGIPDAGYIAVVRMTGPDPFLHYEDQTWSLRFGIYNTPGVATAQAKKVAKRRERPDTKVEWWIEKAETTWVRVNP